MARKVLLQFMCPNIPNLQMNKVETNEIEEKIHAATCITTNCVDYARKLLQQKYTI